MKTSIDVDDDLWADVKSEAARERIKLGALLRRLLAKYVHDRRRRTIQRRGD